VRSKEQNGGVSFLTPDSCLLIPSNMFANKHTIKMDSYISFHGNLYVSQILNRQVVIIGDFVGFLRF